MNLDSQNVPAAPRATVLQLEPALVERIVAKVPLFQGVPPSQLKHLIAMGELCRFTVGECVFNEGEPGNSFYLLLTGEVSVDKWNRDRNVVLSTLGPGACFGEMALLNEEPRSATVRALGNLLTLRFKRDMINANAAHAAAIYRNIACILAHRLGQSSLMLADLATRERH